MISFKQLKIWQKAYELAMKVRKITATFPGMEKFGLTDRTNRSSASVMALIAESHGRYFYKDKIRVLYEARGEIEESRSHLFLANGLGYLSLDELNLLDSEYEGLSKGINFYIKTLKND